MEQSAFPLPGRLAGAEMTEEADILLVDDSAADAELTVRELCRSELVRHIQVVHDGEQALDFLFCRGA